MKIQCTKFKRKRHDLLKLVKIILCQLKKTTRIIPIPPNYTKMKPKFHTAKCCDSGNLKVTL